MWMDYVKTLVVLFGTLLLIMAAVRLLLPKLAGRQRSPFLKVIARYSLEPRKTLYIVQAGSKVLLLASSSHSVSHLSDLENEFEIGESAPQAEWNRAAGFLSVFNAKQKSRGTS